MKHKFNLKFFSPFKKNIAFLIGVMLCFLFAWWSGKMILNYFLYQSATPTSLMFKNQIPEKNYWKLLEQNINVNLQAVKPSDLHLQLLEKMALKNKNNKQAQPWLIINFWGTWCPPCVRELPLLNQFSQANTDEILMLGIAFVDASKIKGFLNEQQLAQNLKINYPLLTANTIDFMQHFSAQSYFPLTVLINPEGRLVERHIGEIDAATLEKWKEKIK